jgi:F-type H+-transporting ATPase subunit b
VNVVAALILAQESGGSTNPILPKTNELIVGIFAFLVLFLLLWRVALPRANQTLEERTRNIEGKLEQAERERQEAEELLRKYRQQLASAEDEAQRIIDEARTNADRLRRDLMAKAEQEANRVIEQGREAIRGERDRAVRQLRTEVGSLAVELATRVIGDSLDRDRQLRLIDQYIEQLSDHAQAGAMTGRRQDGSGAAE